MRKLEKVALSNFFDTLKGAGTRSFSLSKNPGVDKGPQPLMALFGFGDMRGKSAKALA